MKRFSILVLLLMSLSSLMAQSRYVLPEGLVAGDGALHYTYPHSTLVVDLTLVEEQVMAGPYARYALKYLGLRAPFSDKTTYRLESASPALMSDEAYVAPAEQAVEQVVESSYSRAGEEFPALTADRTELVQLSAESAAEKAATRIFQLRRSRLDLITGAEGEHVFGEGLKVALEEIERQEQALLELFLGRKIVTRKSHRIELAPQGDKQQYILCRFSAAEGVLDSSDLSGEIVLLELLPGEPYAVKEAPEKAKSVVRCRVAAPTQCTVSCSGEKLGSRTLPLFEFGRTVLVER